MTFNFKNVYLNDVATVAGPYEKKGPLGKYMDTTYDDFYCGEKSFEDAEIKMHYEAVKNVLKKVNKDTADILISGDLLNQLVSSNLTALKSDIPYLGIYNACTTSTEGLIIASSLVDTKKINNAITSVSSHNCTSERQFRYPVEYGGSKPKTTTFTSTGACAAYVSNSKSQIKIESGTIGRVVDMGVKDVYNMGAVMAPAAAQTIYEHLKDTNRDIDYYDLILTGDLGIYGMKILKDYMKEVYDIDLKKYNDCGVMLYDTKNQDVYAGASGPACLPLVTYSLILKRMQKKEIKKVLLVATGSLHSTTLVNQKKSIPAISHAISLEVEK